jgi:hypothetical protein
VLMGGFHLLHYPPRASHSSPQQPQVVPQRGDLVLLVGITRSRQREEVRQIPAKNRRRDRLSTTKRGAGLHRSVPALEAGSWRASPACVMQTAARRTASCPDSNLDAGNPQRSHLESLHTSPLPPIHSFRTIFRFGVSVR